MRTPRLVLPVLAAALLAACSDQVPTTDGPAAAAPLLGASASRAIDGRYIVVLRDGADPRSVAAV
jgi:hypothetical protein